MPWTRLVYNQGKVWGLPEIGIVSLINKQGKLVMGVEKLEVIVDYNTGVGVFSGGSW